MSFPVNHYSELLRHFTRQTGDRDMAADLVQETYLRVLGLAAQGTGIRHLRALLYRTGRNLLINQVRRKAIEARVLDTLSLVSEASAPSAERQADGREQLKRLLALLQSMPRKRREVFILVRIHGFSHAEAARHLGLSETAIERHMVRALMQCAGYPQR